MWYNALVKLSKFINQRLMNQYLQKRDACIIRRKIKNTTLMLRNIFQV